jgi:hypothetical protein
MAKNRKPPRTEVSLPAQENLEDRIRERAYEIYVLNGCQDGRDVEDWLQAESEIRQETQAPATATVSTAAA